MESEPLRCSRCGREPTEANPLTLSLAPQDETQREYTRESLVCKLCLLGLALTTNPDAPEFSTDEPPLPDDAVFHGGPLDGHLVRLDTRFLPARITDPRALGGSYVWRADPGRYEWRQNG